jgi:hypothetical protein
VPVRIKRVVAAAAFTTAVLLAPPGAAATSSGRFTDDDGNVHESMIEAVAGAGVAAGCGPRMYCPIQDVSRAQMAAFLARALDLPPASVDHFADDDDSPHQDAINRVAEAGIATGRSPGSFAPREPVQRAEMAAFLTRGFDLGPTDRDYFADDNGHVHEDAINRVATAGITRGCGGLDFCPLAPVHRDQMASFLGRALGLAPLTPGERVFEGNGSATVQLVKPGDGPVIAEISHVGASAFVVTERHADGTRGNVLVEDRAGYHGIVLVDRPVGDDAETAGFDITADGSWRIVVRAVADAVRFGVAASGFGGDAVVVYTGEAGRARITHDGPGRFAVWSHGEGVSDLVVDTTGPYDEVVPFPRGDRVIEIRNSGSWSITPE